MSQPTITLSRRTAMQLMTEVPELYLQLAAYLLARERADYEQMIEELRTACAEDGEELSDESIVDEFGMYSDLAFEGMPEEAADPDEYPFIVDMLWLAFEQMDRQLLARTILELMRHPAKILCSEITVAP